ncbi:MAG: thioredoxin family protein [Pseudomonadota bacterium]|nr:thioredoxin family protein [Pseudomonadota bacterium]
MRSLTITLLLFVAAIAAPVARSSEVPYDATAFATALKSGAPMAVVFHADWCPTCRAQAPILEELSREPKFKGVTVFIADFDKELALRQQLRVNRQSTIVVFNKGQERKRSTGETQREGLAAVLSAVGDGI